MITGIAHACIGARDLAEAEAFYCGILGMKRTFAFRKGAEVRGLYLDTGSGFIEIFPGECPPEEGVQRIRHICLLVDDLAALREQVIARGGEITEKKLGCDGSWQAWMTDPSGVRLEFHEYTRDSAQKTGKDCNITW